MLLPQAYSIRIISTPITRRHQQPRWRSSLASIGLLPITLIHRTLEKARMAHIWGIEWRKQRKNRMLATTTSTKKIKEGAVRQSQHSEGDNTAQRARNMDSYRWCPSQEKIPGHPTSTTPLGGGWWMSQALKSLTSWERLRPSKSIRKGNKSSPTTARSNQVEYLHLPASFSSWRILTQDLLRMKKSRSKRSCRWQWFKIIMTERQTMKKKEIMTRPISMLPDIPFLSVTKRMIQTKKAKLRDLKSSRRRTANKENASLEEWAPAKILKQDREASQFYLSLQPTSRWLRPSRSETKMETEDLQRITPSKTRHFL